MSFQDVEAGIQRSTNSPPVPQSPEDAAFISLQSSLSLQVLKMNANDQ
ncbi:hypothetical protein MPER_14126, partial [Moniliophthora perniciosa FA553]